MKQDDFKEKRQYPRAEIHTEIITSDSPDDAMA